MRTMKRYLSLCKIRISLLAAFSALAGSVLASYRITGAGLAAALGVFVLACGASGLNQFLERDTDALMPRTKKRPIPSGMIAPSRAVRFSLLLVAAGLAILSLISTAAFAFGLTALAWYDGLYTWLKRRTAFAVAPGALVGLIPPAIGWVAGGGALSDPTVLALCLLLGIWQIPHFWVLMLRYGDEYASAGLPSLTTLFAAAQIRRITAVWTFATVVCSLLFILFFSRSSGLVNSLVLLSSLWIVVHTVRLLTRTDSTEAPLAGRINLYMVLVLLLIIIGRV